MRAAVVVTLVFLAPLVAGAVGKSALHELPIERETVQSGTVFELNVGLAAGDPRTCAALLADDGRTFCPMVGRRWELGELDRGRMVALANSVKAARAARSCAPTHAFLFQTTRGPRVVDVSFACHSLNGRTLSPGAEAELTTFLRGKGLIFGLPSGG